MLKTLLSIALFLPYLAGLPASGASGSASALRVGAAAAELVAENSMIIGGGIEGGPSQGQEGQLRAVAVVLEKPGQAKAAIVACDVLMLNRDLLDPVVEELAAKTGIPPENILINATHTHHAPSTVTVHGYKRDEEFCRRTQRGIVEAVVRANENLEDGKFEFRLGEESSFGQNSRLLLSDGTIFGSARTMRSVPPGRSIPNCRSWRSRVWMAR
jgi:hypothetical protein